MSARKKDKTKKTTRTRVVRKAKPSAPILLDVVRVGDAVRIPPDTPNLFSHYASTATPGKQRREAIQGIVCSIRDIRTGKFTAKTSGDLSNYVFEILHNQTFRLHFASDRNTGGPRGPEDLRYNPVWCQVREALKQKAAQKSFVNISAGGLLEDPLRSLLDGWSAVKVRAERIQALE